MAYETEEMRDYDMGLQCGLAGLYALEDESAAYYEGVKAGQLDRKARGLPIHAVPPPGEQFGHSDPQF